MRGNGNGDGNGTIITPVGLRRRRTTMPALIRPEGESGRRGFSPVHFLRITLRSASLVSRGVNVLWPVVPAAIAAFLAGKVEEKESQIVVWLRRRYEPGLDAAMRRPSITVGGALGAVALAALAQHGRVTAPRVDGERRAHQAGFPAAATRGGASRRAARSLRTNCAALRA